MQKFQFHTVNKCFHGTSCNAIYYQLSNILRTQRYKKLNCSTTSLREQRTVFCQQRSGGPLQLHIFPEFPMQVSIDVVELYGLVSKYVNIYGVDSSEIGGRLSNSQLLETRSIMNRCWINKVMMV